MPTLPTPGEDAGTWGTELNDWLTKGGQVFNVKDGYGAAGDGVADDTAEIQAAIDAANTLTAAGRGGTVFFPTGQYKITAPLLVHTGGGGFQSGAVSLVGANRDSTCIQQENDNTAIFKASADGTYSQSVTFRDLRLQWKNQQTTSHTNSYAIGFPSSPGSYVSWTVERCWLNRAHIAIGYTDASGTPSAWNIAVCDTWITSTAQTAIEASPPTAIGQPSWYLDHVYIANTGVGHPTGTALAPAGSCISCVGAGMTAIDLDIEGWYNNVISYSGTAESGVFQHIYLEWHKMNGASIFGASPAVFYLASDAIFDGVFISGDNESGATTSSVFWADSTATVRLRGISTAVAVNAGAIKGIRSSSTATVYFDHHWRHTGGTLTLPGDTARIVSSVDGYETVASAATITLPFTSSTFSVTGTTTITSVTASWPGRRVTLIFAGALTFTDGSNLKLNGNFVTTADDTITLVCDGTNWVEVARSVN